LGVEKKEESDFDSFTVAAAAVVAVVDCFPSFLTITKGRDDDAADTALDCGTHAHLTLKPELRRSAAEERKVRIG
jgi:hypothetical protein